MGFEAESNLELRSEWQGPTCAPAPCQQDSRSNSKTRMEATKRREKRVLLCALEAGRLALPCHSYSFAARALLSQQQKLTVVDRESVRGDDCDC